MLDYFGAVIRRRSWPQWPCWRVRTVLKGYRNIFIRNLEWARNCLRQLVVDVASAFVRVVWGEALNIIKPTGLSCTLNR